MQNCPVRPTFVKIVLLVRLLSKLTCYTDVLQDIFHCMCNFITGRMCYLLYSSFQKHVKCNSITEGVGGACGISEADVGVGQGWVRRWLRCSQGISPTSGGHRARKSLSLIDTKIAPVTPFMSYESEQGYVTRTRDPDVYCIYTVCSLNYSNVPIRNSKAIHRAQ